MSLYVCHLAQVISTVLGSWPEIADMDPEHVRTLTNKMADLLYINH
jgi:hypothetical protein